jgi:hypothetical protein
LLRRTTGITLEIFLFVSVINLVGNIFINMRRLNENDMSSLIKKVVAKLKGVSDDQIKYNMKHDLPWDWNGSKEGFYEKMEPKRKHSGSN